MAALAEQDGLDGVAEDSDDDTVNNDSEIDELAEKIVEEKKKQLPNL